MSLTLGILLSVLSLSKTGGRTVAIDAEEHDFHLIVLREMLKFPDGLLFCDFYHNLKLADNVSDEIVTAMLEEVDDLLREEDVRITCQKAIRKPAEGETVGLVFVSILKRIGELNDIQQETGDDLDCFAERPAYRLSKQSTAFLFWFVTLVSASLATVLYDGVVRCCKLCVTRTGTRLLKSALVPRLKALMDAAVVKETPPIIWQDSSPTLINQKW